MFFRVKPAGPYRYLQIAHSVREGKKVRQQVIATLGRLDLWQQSGQLERLMRSGVRHCQSFTVLDPHGAGKTMGFWGEPLPAEGPSSTTGPVRCTKDFLEEWLFERRRDLF